MKAFLTVIGRDRVGIIADVSNKLAKNNVNILDITQTILHDYFTMVMFISLENSDMDIASLQAEFADFDKNIEIRIQSEEIFNSMHRL
ncbi:MAG: ACT domain-containing protein [Clostridia bacterium]|nr:ACT domain-containing protein [Clostridia bacterium]